MLRRRATSLHILVLIAAVSVWTAPAEASERDAPGDLVVTLEPGASIEPLAERYGASVVEGIPGTTTFRLRAKKARKALKRLNRNSAVRRASRDGIVRRQQTVSFPHDGPQIIPTDQDPAGLYRQQLDETGRLEALQVDSASALTESGDEVVIAVLDTGVDVSHPALANRLWTNSGEIPGNGVDDDGDGYVDDVSGWDFVRTSADVDEAGLEGPIVGHGTFIAGLIALTAPRARIMPLRVLDGTGTGSAFDAAAAVNFAAQHGARVISMSFGAEGVEAPEVLRDAVAAARELGVVLVAAVGNSASSFIPYPASDTDHVISVAATDENQDRAEFSNFADDIVTVFAPGVDLVSAMPGTNDDGSPRYAVWSGTSFATALVSAGCTALLATDSVSDPEDVKNRIANNGPKNADGSGRQVNFFEAVGSVLADAGALDIYSASGLFAVAEGIDAGGYVVLRTIGDAQRLTAYAYGMGSFEAYDLYVSAISDPERFLRVNLEDSTQADFCGNFKFVAADDVSPGDPTPILPLPLDQIKYVVFVRASDGRATIGANVDPASETVSVWAGVGLKALAPPDGSPPPFARAWFAFDPQNEGANQAFAVASCQLQSQTEYALVINGTPMGRARSSDDGGGVGSVTFYYSTDGNEVAHNGATLLSAATTPQIFPVTKIQHVTLARVETDGRLTAVVAGAFAAGAQRVAARVVAARAGKAPGTLH